MRAVEIQHTGGPEVMQVRELPIPEPQPGEVLIRVAASGVNFIDLYVREGRYSNQTPFTPGQEAAGTIVAVGPQVLGLKVVERVAWCSVLGTYAEYAVAPAERVVPIPDGVTFEQAAAVLLQGMTAHYLSQSAYPIQTGDELLVHAGAGGTGLLLTQMAKARGARVLTTVSSENKAALSREAGADESLSTRRPILHWRQSTSQMAVACPRYMTLWARKPLSRERISDVQSTPSQIDEVLSLALPLYIALPEW